MRVASARSPGASRVMSDCLVSTVTAAPSAASPGRSVGGDGQQIGVPVVHDPVLRSGQPRREPAAHRPGAAAQVVDHLATGRRKMPPQLFDEVGRAGRSVGRLAEGEPRPADPDALGGHREAPARTPASGGRGGRPPGERRAALAGGAAGPVPQLGVGEPRPERRAERRRVVGRNEQPGPDPVGAVTESLGQPADLGCDDRQAAGQRLGDDHAVGLGARRQHEQVRGGVAALEVDSGPRSRRSARGRRSRRPVRGGEDRRRTPGRGPGCPRTRSATTGRRSSPAHRAARRAPCRGVTAATQSSSRPAAVPAARSAASTPGWATCTRSAGSR